MINNIFFIMLFAIIFNKNLNEVSYNDLRTCVIVVCDNLYCKDCLQILSKIQYIWKNDFKTYLITKSKFNKNVSEDLSYFFSDKLDFDDILFVKSDNYFGFSNMIINKYHFKKTPAMIIKKSVNEFVLYFDSLFVNNYDSLTIKRKILNYLNK